MKAATSPSEKLAAALAAECPERRIAETLSACLAATTMNRAGAIEPAWAIRLQAVGMILDHRFGKAVQRTETVSVNLDADQSDNLRDRLAKSPALRQALRGMLADHDVAAVDV